MIEILNTWQSQLRKGYLELCILLILKKQKNYGLELLKILQEKNLDVNEGTLYPLLNRMYKNGWLDSEWVIPRKGGNPKRFYKLNKQSQQLLPQMLAVFSHYGDVINQLEKANDA